MWNSKALIVAAHEFSTAVRSKGFFIGATFMPMVVVIMFLVRSTPHAQNDAVSHAAQLSTFAVPFGLMGLLFMVVFSVTPPLLSSVMEEKTGRISEVMLGSVTPFELMAGKLIGNLGVSLVLAAIYSACGYLAAVVYGYAHLLSFGIFLAFAFFLVIAITLFGSLFIAVGSICDDGKDAQNLIMPMMLLMVAPIFMWSAIFKAPDGNLTIGLSLFPTTAPFVMPLRLALPSPVPLWQVAASLVLAGAFTVACIWAAGKIFRTAILLQGKSVSFAELWRLMRS